MYLNQLDAALKRELKPLYLLSGDVPLLLQETRDKIRQAAYQSGFIQREILTVEPGFDWDVLQQRLQTRSLFSDKSVIDLRLLKWEERCSNIIMDYLNAPANDLLLIISMPKLTSAQQKTKWFKAIGAAGETISIWPIGPHELPQWIRQRLQAAELKADPESIQLLAEWTEGNLLATQQAIEKLQLLYPQQMIDREIMLSILNDNARFSVYDLSNAALLGNADRVTRIIAHLQFEGTEPTIILWALSREIRHLIDLLYQKEQHGTSINQLVQKEWQSRKSLLSAALQRQNLTTLLNCLQRACHIDQMIKGLRAGSYWNALESLALLMAKS